MNNAPADPKTPTESSGEENKSATPEPLTAESLKLPEEFATDETSQKFLGEFVDLMNDQAKTPAERAQGLIDMQARLMEEASKRTSEASTKAWADLNEKWTEEARALPDIGGEKLDKTLTGIGTLIDTYSSGYTEELRSAFDLTGIGNNPHFIRFMHSMAVKLNEPAPVVGGNASSAEQSLASKLYPSMKN